MAVWKPFFMTSMYNTTKFFNMGTHRLRCAMICASIDIRTLIDFRIGHPDLLDVEFAQELLDYVFRWDKQTKNGGDGATTRRLRRYFEISGGGYGTDRIVVYLKGIF
jgi:hypothetical protein